MAGLTGEQLRKMRSGRFGSNFHRVVALAASGLYGSRAEIGRQVGIGRERVKQILEAADARGILRMPFRRYPKRAAGLRNRRA